MIYLLHGPNTVDLDGRIAQLRRDLDPTGFGATTVNTAEDSHEYIRSAVTATPFFGGQRVVIVNVAVATPGGASQSKSDSSLDTIIAIVQSIPQTTALVIRNERTVPSNSRLIKTIQKHGGAIEAFPLLRGGELVEWTINRGDQEGVTLERSAARRLLELLYPTAWNPSPRELRYAPPLDMRLIATEVTKLATAAAGDSVSSDLVEELVTDRSGFTAFKLNDDLYEGRRDRALLELEHVLASGELPERILAQIGREGMALNATRQGRSYDHKDIAAASDVSAGQVGFMLKNKSGWRQRESLARAAEETRRAEWLIKTGRTQRTQTIIVPLVGTVAEIFRSNGDGTARRRSG